MPLGLSVITASGQVTKSDKLNFLPQKNLPGVYSLQLQGAGRFEYYSDFGTTVKPLAGIKWQPVKEDKHELILEFKKDGTLKVEAKKEGKAIDGKYKFTKDDEMEVEMTFMGETKKETMTVKVTKEELTTKDTKDTKDTEDRP